MITKTHINICGNCQIQPLVKLLRLSKNCVVNYISVYAANTQQVYDFHKQLKFCDIFINTLTSSDYRNSIGLGSDHLRSLCKHDCLSLVVPSVYYNGYFPTFAGAPLSFNGMTYNYISNTIIDTKYHDYIPIVLAQHQLFKVQYQDLVNQSSELLYTILQNVHETAISVLQTKEKLCDITISDYISQNLHKELLFTSNNHPTNHLMKHFLTTILLKLDSFNIQISKILDVLQNYTGNILHTNDIIFLYPFVIQHCFNSDIIPKSVLAKNVLPKIIKYYDGQPETHFSDLHKNMIYSKTVKILQQLNIV